MASRVAAARGVHCKLQQPRPLPRAGGSSAGGLDKVRIVLQPRLCTLRSSSGSESGGMIRTATTSKEINGGGGGGMELELTPLMVRLYEYVESSKKSQDFEIITGRIAMILFAVTMGFEMSTGNSIFKKVDIDGIVEGFGACLAAITCATTFAYSSRARKKVGSIFTISCNAFVDALIDNIVDSLCYESEGEIDEGSQNNDNSTTH